MNVWCHSLLIDCIYIYTLQHTRHTAPLFVINFDTIDRLIQCIANHTHTVAVLIASGSPNA